MDKGLLNPTDIKLAEIEQVPMHEDLVNPFEENPITTNRNALAVNAVNIAIQTTTPDTSTPTSAHTLPDIELPTIDYADLYGQETVGDSSSSASRLSTSIRDRDESVRYPLVGYSERNEDKRRIVDFDMNQARNGQLLPLQQGYHLQYPQEMGSVQFPQEPQNIYPVQENGYLIQDPYDQQQEYGQAPIYNQQHQNYGRTFNPSEKINNPHYQQLQESNLNFRPRQDSRFKDPNFYPSRQKQPTPRTSLQRQADGIGIPPVTRYCCGIFRTRKKCRLICIPIFVILVIAIGLTTFLIYPRSLDIGMTSGLYQTGEVNLSGDFKRSNLKLSLSLFGNFSAHSPNHIPYPAHISVQGSLMNPNDKSPARVNGQTSTSLKADKQLYTSPGHNSFQTLLYYTYTQSSGPYTKNLLRQVDFKQVDGDLQTLFLSCSPELIGVLPYPNRKLKTLTVKLDWRVDVSITNHGGGVERDLECPEGIMRMLKKIAEGFD
jgi:hypothetical protein